MTDSIHVKSLAQGRWVEILSSLAPLIGDAIKNPRRHFPCPMHGGHDGLRAFADVAQTGGVICNTCGSRSDGFETLMWVNGWDFKTAIEATQELLGEPAEPTNEKAQKSRIRRIQALWMQRQRMSWPLAKYLQNRGLNALRGRVPACLCALPRMEYWEQTADDWKLQGRHPGMVAPITDMAGNLVSLHRTFLDEHGNKAGVESPKKFMMPAVPGSLSGCSIKLYPADKELAICEGIETALAVHLMTGLPTWATGSSRFMMTVQIPPIVETVYIFADRDRSCAGEDAAHELVTRILAEKRIGKIVLPRDPIPNGKKSFDWLDVYNNRGAVA